MTEALLIVVVMWLAYANGTNDTFKGVATLFGSGTIAYRQALFWAILTTAAGSLCALWFSQGLISIFSGKGLVSSSVAADPSFLVAVGGGAALTVLAASMIGMPISTTHCLAGGLLGAALAAEGTSLPLLPFVSTLAVPLMLGPVVAATLTVFGYPLLRRIRLGMGVTKDTCVCVDGRDEIAALQPDGSLVMRSAGLGLTVAHRASCDARSPYGGVGAQEFLRWGHYLSAGAVGFARGLNDTPKIIALAGGGAFAMTHSMVMVALSMALGGLLGARRVGETMSWRITSMNDGQGFVANGVTAALVSCASVFGLPLSTTHVSCGSLFGLGAITRGVRWRTISALVFAWGLTIPCAAIASGLLLGILRGMSPVGG